MVMGSSSRPHCPRPAPCLSFPVCPEQELSQEKAPGFAGATGSAPAPVVLGRVAGGSAGWRAAQGLA